MAEGGASQGYNSPKLDLRGARDKDSLFHMSDASTSAARENDEEFRRVKDDFLRVARQLDGENYRGANHQEAPPQFVADHHDDQRICQNSKSHHSMRTMSSYGLTSWRPVRPSRHNRRR